MVGTPRPPVALGLLRISIMQTHTPGPPGRNCPAATLLVVDDDPTIRSLEALLLSNRGYEVLQADSAEAALRLAGTTATIHLLLTDFLMPGIDGLELTRQFREVHPETPVLLVSASLPTMASGIGEISRFEMLAKPFALHELLGKVETLLQDTVLLPLRVLCGES